MDRGDEPRRRILDAALTLASTGGFDALQVRAIAREARVSSRTIYELFPSLESLLIIAVAERAGEALYHRFTDVPARPGTPVERVGRLMDDLSATMTANRVLTVALLRALTCGKPDVAEHVRNFIGLTEHIIATAIAPDGPSADDRAVALILERVWFSGLIGWAIGLERDEDLAPRMQSVTERVLATPR